MRRRKLADLYCFDAFGFKSPAAVERLGKKRVSVTIYFGPFPSWRMLRPLTPKARGLAIRSHFRTVYRTLQPLLPENHQLQDRQYRRCTCTLPASDLKKLRRHNLVEGVWLDACPGRIKRKPQATLSWFSVYAIFVLQVEGQTRGLQDCENRFVVIQALNPSDAVRRLKKPFKAYGAPYLNVDNRLVRWKLEEIRDVYPMLGADFRQPWVEVFSKIRSRRMRPEHAWLTPDTRR